MFTVRHIVGTLGCLAVSASLCLAQNIAPSHSGTVDYFQGDVSIDGLQLISKTARFSTLKEQSVLKTGEGRAELLLTPGVILRVGENSSVRMLDSDLMHTQVQLVSGSAMVEATESGTDVKDPPVTIEAMPSGSQVLAGGPEVAVPPIVTVDPMAAIPSDTPPAVGMGGMASSIPSPTPEDPEVILGRRLQTGAGPKTAPPPLPRVLSRAHQALRETEAAILREWEALETEHQRLGDWRT